MRPLGPGGPSLMSICAVWSRPRLPTKSTPTARVGISSCLTPEAVAPEIAHVPVAIELRFGVHELRAGAGLERVADARQHAARQAGLMAASPPLPRRLQADMRVGMMPRSADVSSPVSKVNV